MVECKRFAHGRRSARAGKQARLQEGILRTNRTTETRLRALKRLGACCLAACLAFPPTAAWAQSIDDPLSESEIAASEQAVAALSGASMLGVEDTSWRWPLPGIGADHISQHFGENGHSGMDIWADEGTPIVAAAAGYVSGDETNGMMDGYGNCVTIYHGDGVTTLYGHMSARAVGIGDWVERGQVIGYVGSTGWSTGNHLHFEMCLNTTETNIYGTPRTRIDPEPFVLGNDYDEAQPESTFYDVDFNDLNCWYSTWVRSAVDEGLMAGSDGYFRPDGVVTRAEAVTVIWRAATGQQDGTAWYNAGGFNDCELGSWYMEPVNWAVRTGVVDASKASFNPDQAITREELCAMITRYAESSGMDTSVSDMAFPAGCSDWNTVSPWAVDYVTWCAGEGIVTGKDQGNGTTLMCPQETATRAELSKIIVLTNHMVG